MTFSQNISCSEFLNFSPISILVFGIELYVFILHKFPSTKILFKLCYFSDVILRNERSFIRQSEGRDQIEQTTLNLIPRKCNILPFQYKRERRLEKKEGFFLTTGTTQYGARLNRQIVPDWLRKPEQLQFFPVNIRETDM